MDPQLQRRLMGQFATGVTVVTARCGEELVGMTANAVTSLSLDPPLLLVAVDQGAQMNRRLREAGSFAVSILSEEQEHLSRRFAARGPKDFSDLSLTTAVTGAPALADALAWLDCRVTAILPGGDHQIFIGQIVAGQLVEAPAPRAPLLYFGGKYARLGG